MSESDEITAETTSPMLGGSDDGDEGRAREPWKGEIVKSIVYAGLEAIFTCFSLISSISARQLSPVDVFVLGIANLVAEGISLGLGDFLSTSTKKDLAVKEMAVTEWDATNHRKDQQQQLLQQFQNLGMDVGDAETVVYICAKYNDILVGQKVAAQKGMLLPDHQVGEKPWKNGVATFVAFVVFGTAPLLSFITLKPFTDNELVLLIGACFMSALALSLLGIARAKIAGKNYPLSIGIVLLNGAVAGAAAYFLGWMLGNVADLEELIMIKLASNKQRNKA